MTGGEQQRREFLGLRFDALDRPAALAAVRARGPAARFAYVVTPNVDHVVRLHRRPGLRPLYDGAWLTLCDSRPLGHLARRSGIRLPVVPGSDLTQDLFRALDPGDRVAVIGTVDAEALRRAVPHATIVHHDPPMGFIDDPAAADHAARFAAAARARYLLLAVGSPQQERLAHAIAGRGDAIGTGLCVGASLDFLTGRRRRAPGIVQRLSLEWLFRLGADPVRLWRRYLLDGPVIFLLWRRWLAARRPSVRSAAAAAARAASSRSPGGAA